MKLYAHNSVTLPKLMSGFIHEVLDVLRAHTGVDFATYRPAMLERRIQSRMSAVHIARPPRHAASSSGMRASTRDWVRKCWSSCLGTR